MACPEAPSFGSYGVTGTVRQYPRPSFGAGARLVVELTREGLVEWKAIRSVTGKCTVRAAETGRLPAGRAQARRRSSGRSGLWSPLNSAAECGEPRAVPGDRGGSCVTKRKRVAGSAWCRGSKVILVGSRSNCTAAKCQRLAGGRHHAGGRIRDADDRTG